MLPGAHGARGLIAEVRGDQRAEEITTLRGQVDIATTTGEVLSLRIDPRTRNPACPVVEAIGAARMVVLGPGGWFTSVLPHLCVRGARCDPGGHGCHPGPW